jgi:hypothetical protein
MILVGEAAEVVLAELQIRSDGIGLLCCHRFPFTAEYCQKDREYGSEFCKIHRES